MDQGRSNEMRYKACRFLLGVIATTFSSVSLSCSCYLGGSLALWDMQLGGKLFTPNVYLVEFIGIEQVDIADRMVKKAHYKLIDSYRGEIPTRGYITANIPDFINCDLDFPKNLVGKRWVMFTHDEEYPYSYGQCSTHIEASDEIIRSLEQLSRGAKSARQ